MAEEVFMEIPAVEDVQKKFQGMADVTQQISNILRIAADILRATAFFGMIGNMILAWYTDQIRNIVDQLHQMSLTIAGGVGGAIRSYRDGDNSGSQLFV
jgi:hypothetical protein